VRLEKLGTFYPALHSNGKKLDEEIDNHVIRSVGVNYRPGDRILSTLRDAGKKKVKITLCLILSETKLDFTSYQAWFHSVVRLCDFFRG
jgi:hypothetical protein